MAVSAQAACSNASAAVVPNPRTPMSASCGKCSHPALIAAGGVARSIFAIRCFRSARLSRPAALVAAVAASLLSPEQAAPVAFIGCHRAARRGGPFPSQGNQNDRDRYGEHRRGGYLRRFPLRHHCGLSGLIPHSPDVLFSPRDPYGIVTALRRLRSMVIHCLALQADSGLRVRTQPGCIQSDERRRPLRRP